MTARRKLEWEEVCDEPDNMVRRMKLDLGWLYQVQTAWRNLSGGTCEPVWGPPVFVAA